MVGGNKLQVADVFFPSLLKKSILPNTNRFLFSNFGLIMAQQTIIHVNCFKARDNTRAILSQKCTLWERGLEKLLQL